MDHTDIAIIGGGLAGSMAAAMLGRAGIAAVLIDPRPVYPPELRCEKIGGEQIALLHKTGLAEATLEATTILATLIRSASFEWDGRHTPEPVSRVTLRPKGGMPLIVRPL